MSVQIITADCREALRAMPAESVHCIVTSPPYWGLRDYGVDGAMGLEATLAEYVDGMVEIFREVRRVLRPDGTLWLNLGDCYASSPPGNKTLGVSDKSTLAGVNSQRYRETLAQSVQQKRSTLGGGLKPKDLLLIPARVALALQADGWWVRKEIIWHKPNPMPESVTDRPTSAHEKVYLLTKSERYFYDADAVRERGSDERPWGALTRRKPEHNGDGRGNRFDQYRSEDRSRNLRDVWTIATAPYPEAHFATFPPALVEPCIKAGTSDIGCCPECAIPWKSLREFSCSCGCTDDAVPCRVLDPFAGAGTVGLVADQLGRDAILIEISPAYAELARKRIDTDAATRGRGPPAIMRGDDLPLFGGAE